MNVEPSANWSTHPSQYIGGSLSSTVNLAKFQYDFHAEQICQGASAFQWNLESLHIPREYSIPSTPEVPAMFTF